MEQSERVLKGIDLGTENTFLIMPEDRQENAFAFTKKCIETLRYRDNADWVEITPDASRAVQVVCPKCRNIGMFIVDGLDFEETHDSHVIKKESIRLECVWCEHYVKLPRTYGRIISVRSF